MTRQLASVAAIRTLPDPATCPLMRVDELVGFIPGMGRSALYEAVAAGDIPAVRIRGKWFIPTGELRRAWGVDSPIEDGAA